MSSKLDKTFNISPLPEEENTASVIKKDLPDRLTKDDITRDVKSSGASTSTCTSFSSSSLKALYLLPAV